MKKYQKKLLNFNKIGEKCRLKLRKWHENPLKLRKLRVKSFNLKKGRKTLMNLENVEKGR